MQRIEESVAGARYVALVMSKARDMARSAITFLTDTCGLDKTLVGFGRVDNIAA